MSDALREYQIIGILSSIPFHQWVISDEAFLHGEYDTSFLEDQFSLEEPERENHRQLAAIVATLLSHEQRQRSRLKSKPCDEGSGGDCWQRGRSWKLAGRQDAMD